MNNATAAELVARSNRLGSDPRVTNYAGGNTSAKGSEIDPVTYAMLLEEIAAGDGSVSTMVSVHNSPTCIVIANAGSDAQKDRWLRPLATGEAVGSFGLTEPQAGSDASNLRTRAVKKGGVYIVNGSKQFISNATHPGSLVFFAVTDPAAGKRGISCFVIDKNHPGFSVTRTEEKLGQKASDTCALSFDNVEIPEDLRIGAEGEGYKIALSTLESGRIDALRGILGALAATEHGVVQLVISPDVGWQGRALRRHGRGMAAMRSIPRFPVLARKHCKRSNGLHLSISTPNTVAVICSSTTVRR